MKNPYKVGSLRYEAYERSREDMIKGLDFLKNPYARVNNNILDHYFEEIKVYFLVEIRKRD